MKISKITATLAIATFALAANAAPEKDRSYVTDFANKKTELTMRDSTAGKTSKVVFKEAKAKEIVLVDAETGGEFTVPTNSTSFRFSYAKPDELNQSFFANNRGETDLAIAGMRGYVYPVVGFLSMHESAFYQLNETLGQFVTLLLKQGKIKEASALVKVMPLGNANIQAQKSAIEIGKAMVTFGDEKGALEILNRIPLSGDYVQLYPEVMDLAANIRKMKISMDIQRFYAQQGNVEENPLKNTCRLWAIYCELLNGSLTSAKLSLGTMKGSFKNTDTDFPLYKMVEGLRAAKEKNNVEALDLYAEGIVFAKASDPCLPELLYNTGLAYKAEKNTLASNEIFKQISMLYPSDPISSKALKEIVKEKKKTEDAQNN